jgi:hypothetical protein
MTICRLLPAGLLSILVGLIAAGCSGCSGVLVMFAHDAPERDFHVAELLIDEEENYDIHGLYEVHDLDLLCDFTLCLWLI